MRYKALTAARSYMVPLTALLLAAALGGCVAYPPARYSYNYPSSYYGGYPSTYTYSYNAPAYYSSSYYPPGYAAGYSPDYTGTFVGYPPRGGDGR
jgi:hypothetical protein